MQILVACEESQAVTIALRKLGHEAYSCDLIPCSGGHPEWHIQQDVLPLLNGYCFFKTCDGSAHYVLGRWDMLIAFPPCTYLTNASAVRMRVKGEIVAERYAKAMEAKAFFMSFLSADCAFGAHLESCPNRFQQMQVSHPKQYDYCMRPVDQGGLGMAKVLDYIGVDH